MDNLIGFEKEIIEKLKASGLIEKFSVFEFNQTPDLERIIKMFEEPSVIDFDDNGIFYIDEDGEKAYCPQMYSSISDKGEWLSDNLPTIDFDINQNGNVRKADEAEALYCVIVVSQILKENDFKNEVIDLSRKYDFNDLKEITSDGLSFRKLLTEWLDLQSEIINIIVSACKYKISNFKKVTEKFLKDGISESEATELRDLEAKIRAINFDYSEGVLSPQNIKKLDKIERLKNINERDLKISKLIMRSQAGTLFRIINLSTEYISPIKKKRIALWVQKEVDELLEKDQYVNMTSDRSQLIAKFKKRALRYEKNSVRKLNVEKYITSRSDYKLPSKL